MPDSLFAGQMKDITYQAVYKENGTLIYENLPKDDTESTTEQLSRTYINAKSTQYS